jgi:hypothetical protein
VLVRSRVRGGDERREAELGVVTAMAEEMVMTTLRWRWRSSDGYSDGRFWQHDDFFVKSTGF